MAPALVSLAEVQPEPAATRLREEAGRLFRLLGGVPSWLADRLPESGRGEERGEQPDGEAAADTATAAGAPEPGVTRVRACSAASRKRPRLRRGRASDVPAPAAAAEVPAPQKWPRTSRSTAG